MSRTRSDHSRYVAADAVHGFYACQPEITKVRRIGPVTVVGNFAGFQFVIEYHEEGESKAAAITDLLGFDDDGRIVPMRGARDPSAT